MQQAQRAYQPSSRRVTAAQGNRGKVPFSQPLRFAVICTTQRCLPFDLFRAIVGGELVPVDYYHYYPPILFFIHSSNLLGTRGPEMSLAFGKPAHLDRTRRSKAA